MAYINKIFSKVPIEVPNRSGFDKSHENLLTAKCGTLVPVLCDELLPNDKVTLGLSSHIQLPPMATDFYGRVRGKFEAFFVPNRILYGGWQDFITHPVNGAQYPDSSYANVKAKCLPFVKVSNSDLGPGSLGDYLGLKSAPSRGTPSGTTTWIPNILPFVAYAKIWDDWYRDSRIQRSLFARPSSSTPSVVGPSWLAALPYSTFCDTTPEELTNNYADYSKLTQLRQRNWAKDYFTNATSSPQAGDASSLSFGVHIESGYEDGTGSFTIAALRAANSLEQWMERNNIAGPRYGDQIKAQYGIYPADAVTDRAIYLGSGSVDVYNKSVYMDHSDSGASGRNPFNSTGAKYGSPIAVGDMSLVDSFTASEHGFLMVVFSLVPDALYSTGNKRMFTRRYSSDFAFPLLAGVGDQEIVASEIVADYLDPLQAADESSSFYPSFGYTQRYSEYKFMLDEVHGLLRSGQSLEHFALDRAFSTNPSLGSSFLEIPTTFLDDVSAVADSVSDYGCWADIFFKYKVSSTLPAYSIPTLGDMKDTHTEIIDNGGKRL